MERCGEGGGGNGGGGGGEGEGEGGGGEGEEEEQETPLVTKSERKPSVEQFVDTQKLEVNNTCCLIKLISVSLFL